MSGRYPRMRVTLSPWLLPALALALCMGSFPLWCMSMAAVVLHELCHAAAARAMGFAVRRLEILPVGARADIVGLFETEPSCEVGIALAGPMGNLLCVMLLTAVSYFRPAWCGDDLGRWITAHLTVALCNLIPALPLDGGRVLRGLLSLVMPAERAGRAAAWAGVALGGVLTAAAAALFLVGTLHPTAWFLGIFLVLGGWKEIKTAPLLSLRQSAGKKENLMRRGSMPLVHLAVREDLPLSCLVRRLRPGCYAMITLVDREGRNCGTVSESDAVRCLLEGRGVRAADVPGSIGSDPNASGKSRHIPGHSPAPTSP